MTRFDKLVAINKQIKVVEQLCKQEHHRAYWEGILKEMKAKKHILTGKTKYIGFSKEDMEKVYEGVDISW